MEKVSNGPAFDHKGNVYDSVAAMCRAYGISAPVFAARRKKGWDVEKSLTTTIYAGESRPVTDHNGVEYPSMREMLKHYGLPWYTYNNRKKLGWSQERALTTPVRERRAVGQMRQERDLQAAIDASGLTYEEIVNFIQSSFPEKEEK